MSETEFTYVGSELDLFSAAKNWKNYFRNQLAPYLGQDVLEVGAGLGGTTRVLCRGTENRWVCLEPDPTLVSRLDSEIASGNLPNVCRSQTGIISDLDPAETFDTVLYMDVLEHIEDDRAEVARAAARLRKGGHIIALSPAHQWLFTPFDKAIGHCRRYTKTNFGALGGNDLETVRLVYLDSIGFFATADRMRSPAMCAWFASQLFKSTKNSSPP